MRKHAQLVIRIGYLTVALLAACGPTGPGGGQVDADVGTPDSNTGMPDASPPVDAPPPPENAAVYAHSETALYRIDPDTLAVTEIGLFQWPNGADSMTDIAIDKTGRIIGVSFGSVYQVDEITAACTFLADLQGDTFNGLSFVPDPLNPNLDILIGADQYGDVYQLDPQTGAQTLVGNYGGGYYSSGDIVSVVGAGTFATVTMDGATSDYLARIDPTDGYTATIVGDTGFDSIWGLGYWRNTVYGFTDANQFLLIDVNTGSATVEQAGAVQWWGAGVTTLAPIIE